MEINRFARVFKALANPSRLSIFMRLVNCCEPGTLCSTDSEDETTCVGEVARGLKIGPSTVSHHLKELRLAGLIEVVPSGQKRMCRVSPKAIEELKQFLTISSPEEGTIG